MKSICFTGHRTLSEDIAALSKRLYARLEEAIKDGADTFIAGGAIGWDTIACLTVIKLREVYPHIKLHLVLPCSPQEQSEGWTEQERSDYDHIRAAADSVEQTGEHYVKGCMKVRNARLVELADGCFCYWNPKRQRSGTGQTVRMAQRKPIEVVNFFE